MSGTEKTREGIKHFSEENLDTLVKTTSFKEELEEVRLIHTSSSVLNRARESSRSVPGYPRTHPHRAAGLVFLPKAQQRLLPRQRRPPRLRSVSWSLSLPRVELRWRYRLRTDPGPLDPWRHQPVEALRSRVPGRRELARVVPGAARGAVQADGPAGAQGVVAGRAGRPGAAGARGAAGGEGPARGPAAAVRDGVQVRRQRGAGRHRVALSAQGDAPRQGHGRPAAAVRPRQQAARPRPVPHRQGAARPPRRDPVGRAERPGHADQGAVQRPCLGWRGRRR